MPNDPIRDAFDLLERERPEPTLEFADALFERLRQEQAAQAASQRLGRPRRTLPPIVRRILIVAAAIAVAAAILLPLLPLIGNRERPRPAFPTGQIVWVRQFGSDGFDVEPGGLAVIGSTAYLSSSWYERGTYGAGFARLDAFDLDGDPLNGRSVRLDRESGGLVADPNGNVYMLQPNIDGSIGGTVTKYSPEAIVLWQKDLRLGGVVWGLATDGDGVFVVGGTTATLRNQDGFVASLDDGGNVRWQTTLGTDNFDRAGNIAVDTDDIYVAGESGGKNGPATLWKVDLDGSILWSRSIDLGKGLFGPVAVADGIVYVGAENHGDALLAAYDVSGHLLWTKRWGTKDEDWIAGLVAADGRVYVAGTRGFRRTETGPSIAAAKGFIRAFDADGNELWSTEISNSGFVEMTSLAQGSDGLYVAGSTDGTFAGQTATDGENAFVAKVGVG